MPQIFQVLRCYKCLVFQVHQTKKSNKWQCKMCGEKQSIKRHYGIGTAKDCRLHVQKLNGIRGDLDDIKSNKLDTDSESEYEGPVATIENTEMKKESKWSNYVEQINPTTQNDNDPMYLNNKEVVLELPQKRKRNFGNNSRNKLNHVDDQMYIDDEAEKSNNKIVINASNNLNINSKNTNKVIRNDNDDEDSNEFKHTNDGYESFDPISSIIVNQKISTQSTYSCIETAHTGKKMAKKFNPPPIVKNSKWAQYANEDHEQIEETEYLALQVEESQEISDQNRSNDEIENIYSPHIEKLHKKSNSLFALCDDSDLDNVLDV